MKFEHDGRSVKLTERKQLNQQCINAIMQGNTGLSKAELYRLYTGIGGLHGLEYKDYGNYRDFSEAKKEIEQGQFFTSDPLVAWVVDCPRPGNMDKIADLTFGKGSFFNHLPVEENLYGCEIDPESYQVAGYLFDRANLTLGDIRTYEPGILFDMVVGNPPYNISWEYKKRRHNSQAVYLLKAADLLYPAGICAVIVPETFLGESTPKIEKRLIYGQFNHVVQISLNPNAFAYLGVRNFPTKLLVLQKKAKGLPDVPYHGDLVMEQSSAAIYENYIMPAHNARKLAMPQVRLEVNRSAVKRDELIRRFKLYLYQIKCHPNTREEYVELETLVNQYLTQRCPEGMTYQEWQKVRVRSKSVLERLKKALSDQNKQEVDKIELVKGNNRIYYRAYSETLQADAERMNWEMEMQEITQLVTHGTDSDLKKCGAYEKLMRKKRREYLRQTTPFPQMQEDPKIREWLENWKLTGLTKDFKLVEIKLNAMQLHDTNLALQKRYCYLHWSQGAGKTVSGTAQGMYRLAHGQMEYVFVVSSAISIETTWAPFMKMYGVPHKVIRSPRDLRRVYAGDFILITIGRLKNYQKQIKDVVKLACRKLFFIYDEAQNSSTMEENEDVGRLTKATLSVFSSLKYKLLMSGTSISNNVVEVYPQLYLLYNASCNMLSKAQTLYTYDERTDDYRERFNEYYGKPYPPYMGGRNLFRMSHLPEKLTVFGVVKKTQDIFNAQELRDIITYTMITRTFSEVTGKNLECCRELTAVMSPAEMELYEVALKEFYRLEHLYFKSTNMDERKKAQARIIAQIKIMLRICTCAGVFPQYTGSGLTGKLQAIFSEIEKLPDQRVVIGVRQNSIVQEYAKEARRYFPDRPVFTVTGSEYDPRARGKLVFGAFSDYNNSILICTQQSLSESISIDFVDHCFIPELHWNISRMAQFYYRFIRYTSTRKKYIYYVNYPDSIETNLIYLLVSKERMLRFLKGQDVSFEDLFAEMGFDFSKHQEVIVKTKDEKGRAELAWGKQMIAA